MRKNQHVVLVCRGIVITFSVACAGIILYKQAFPASRALNTDARDFYNRYTPAPAPDVRALPGLLSHQIIMIDAERRMIDDHVTRQALGNVNRYLTQVSEKCVNSLAGAGAAGEFLNCANAVLHDNFYYRAADEVGRGYAEHNSDCDANVYLLMDAAKAKGLETFIVYAPGHAFIAWKDKFGTYQFHETTGSNNKGRPFDFRNRLYQKTLDRTYYTPHAYGDPIIEATYRAVTDLMAGYSDNLANMYSRFPDSALINGAWFRWKRENGSVTAADAALIQSQLVADITDSGKYLTLADYYLNTGNPQEARKMFDRVPARDCDTECYSYGTKLGIKKFSWLEAVWARYATYTQSHGVTANTWTFWMIWPKAVVLILLLSFVIWVVLASDKPDTPARSATGWRRWLRF